MQRCLHHWVPLVMLLHEHFQTREWHTEHLSELHRIYGVLLRMEHTRLVLFNVFENLNLRVVTAHTLVLNLSLHFLILNVSLRELLPVIINLFIDQAIGLLKDLSNVIVSRKFYVHLHPDELLHDTCLSVKGINFSSVRVLEVNG